MLSVAVALIGAAGTIIAAVITTRRSGPSGGPVAVATVEGGSVPAVGRVSASLWCGIAGLLLWVIPLLAYVVVIPGLYVGIREQGGARRRTGAGVVLCSVSLGLALLNSAIGAWQGAHGTGWWQQ